MDFGLIHLEHWVELCKIKQINWSEVFCHCLKTQLSPIQLWVRVDRDRSNWICRIGHRLFVFVDCFQFAWVSPVFLFPRVSDAHRLWFLRVCGILILIKRIESEKVFPDRILTYLLSWKANIFSRSSWYTWRIVCKYDDVSLLLLYLGLFRIRNWAK